MFEHAECKAAYLLFIHFYEYKKYTNFKDSFWKYPQKQQLFLKYSDFSNDPKWKPRVDNTITKKNKNMLVLPELSARDSHAAIHISKGLVKLFGEGEVGICFICELWCPWTISSALIFWVGFIKNVFYIHCCNGYLGKKSIQSYFSGHQEHKISSKYKIQYQNKIIPRSLGRCRKCMTPLKMAPSHLFHLSLWVISQEKKHTSHHNLHVLFSGLCMLQSMKWSKCGEIKNVKHHISCFLLLGISKVQRKRRHGYLHLARRTKHSQKCFGIPSMH